jgi:hypothetical protein
MTKNGSTKPTSFDALKLLPGIKNAGPDNTQIAKIAARRSRRCHHGAYHYFVSVGRYHIQVGACPAQTDPQHRRRKLREKRIAAMHHSIIS